MTWRGLNAVGFLLGVVAVPVDGVALAVLAAFEDEPFAFELLTVTTLSSSSSLTELRIDVFCSLIISCEVDFSVSPF